jgi:basic membrane lipoprotein Med (substrate-binding protein (PBP1-ABC) superfamily)
MTGKVLAWTGMARARARRHRATAIGVGATGVVLVGLVIWALWPSAPQSQALRARVYRDLDVCMLTDSKGIVSTPAAPAWQGMQKYSHDTAVRISYVPVIGPATAQNASQYLAGLIQRRCRVIITAGKSQANAAETAAKSHPGTGFIVLTNGPATSATNSANLLTIDQTDTQLAAKIQAGISSLAKTSS